MIQRTRLSSDHPALIIDHSIQLTSSSMNNKRIQAMELAASRARLSLLASCSFRK
jgi:hypothetical protein